MVRSTPGEGQELQDIVRDAPSALGRLLHHPGTDNGFEHTLAEILQQPSTWIETARSLEQRSAELHESLGRPGGILLTGSGSSQYAGDCAQPGLSADLGIPVWSIGSGDILTEVASAVHSVRPLLAVSLARSGDSPESTAALHVMQRADPGVRQLIITCNATGRLAQARAEHPELEVILLAERTNDRSLAMTSSFTNLALAARLLGRLTNAGTMQALALDLARRAKDILLTHADGLAAVAKTGFRHAVFLGSGERYGAARECALKMLEMTGGRVRTMAETYLGLRHGPMSAIHEDTLIVCFLSADPHRRAYECDLLRELHRKSLGSRRVIAGPRVPAELLLDHDCPVEFGPDVAADDSSRSLLYVLAGQLLAFFTCRELGLKPDSPSETGVISRVVEDFRIHGHD